LIGAPKHILLVDDEPGLRQLLITTLASPEFTITQAGSGEQALALARAQAPDLLILDVRLTPEHPNGLEVCRALKSDPATANIRILMLTAAGRPQDRRDATAAGADDYITKPFSPRALLDYIYGVLFD
jgi:DNA-binding response OmpR family regulator